MAGVQIAALHAVLVPERVLHGFESAPLDASPFDGRDRGTVGLRGEHRAAFHGETVQENGAGAALTAFAANLGAGQPQVVPQEVDEEPVWRHAGSACVPVDGNGD